MKIFSFFSGSGFLDLGFEMAGFSVELVNEFSPMFMEAYKYSRAQMKMKRPIHGYHNCDINEFLTIRANELREKVSFSRKGGEFVGFVGGPPCPDFSVAGKQRGKSGDNGKLSQTYVDLIIEQLPDFFLFENVKGLWRTAKHRAYYEELKSKLENHYALTDRLTNAIEFGAPQDRDRIFLFGVRRDICDDLSNFPWEKHIRFDLDDIKKLEWPERTPFGYEYAIECPAGLPKELTAQYWFEKNEVDQHPNRNDHFQPRNGLAKMCTVDEGDDSRKSYKRLHRWRYSPTVCYGNNEVHLHPYKERRLTASEAMALQSLPKEFALPPNMSLTDKFKTIGNGVPFLLAEGIARTIAEFLSEVKSGDPPDCK